MFILSDGEGKNVTVELMEPVCLSINSMYIIINSSSYLVWKEKKILLLGIIKHLYYSKN